MNISRASVLVALAALPLLGCSSLPPEKPILAIPACLIPEDPDQAGLTPAKLRKDVGPSVPMGLQRSGFACVAVTIDVDGRLTDLVLLATDYPAFAKSFVDVLPQWRYEPALRDGVPVPVRTVLTSTFRHVYN